MNDSESEGVSERVSEGVSEGRFPKEVLYKTTAAKADAVSAFINTAGLTGGRATFMAGFSYYSVSE